MIEQLRITYQTYMRYAHQFQHLQVKKSSYVPTHRQCEIATSVQYRARADWKLSGRSQVRLSCWQHLLDHPCVPITQHMGHGFSRRFGFLHDSNALNRLPSLFKEVEGLVQHDSVCPTAHSQSFQPYSDARVRKIYRQIRTRAPLKKPTVPTFEFAIASFGCR